MADTAQDSGMGAITALYRRVSRLYTEIPYQVIKTGYAFPAWHYFFEVTRRCNLRCKMCQYIDWLEQTPTRVQADGELTTEEWLNVIDQTARFGLITFTGGEVFVRKDFMQIFEHACSKRRVHFISNATMLTEERCKRAVELAPRRLGFRGFNFAGISIDGTREVHDVVRAQKGSFDRSIQGIKRLSDFRDAAGKACPIIHINTVIQEESLDCLPEMPRIAKEAGVNVLNLLTEMRSHDLPDLGHVDPGTFSREDFHIPGITREKLDIQLRKTLEEGARLGVEIRMPRMPYEAILDHYDQGYDLKEFECRAVWNNLYVGAKGGVYPCFINKVGNVRENSLKELWNSPQMKEFRMRRREGGFAVCRGCCELEHSGGDQSARPKTNGHAAPKTPELAGVE